MGRIEKKSYERYDFYDGSFRRAPSNPPQSGAPIFGAPPRAAARSLLLCRATRLGYHTSRPVCGERILTTAQKLSERTNRARIISICPLSTTSWAFERI